MLPTTQPSPILTAILPVLEAVGDGIHIFNLAGSLVYANQAAAEFLGFATVEAYLATHQNSHGGLSMMTFYDASGQALSETQRPCLQALNGVALEEQILTYRDCRQRERCAAIRSLPVRDESGAVMYGIVVSRDLTPQSLAPPAMPPTTQQLLQIAEVVPSAIAKLTIHERHSYTNSAYLNLFHETPRSVHGKNLQAVVGTVFHQQLHDDLRQAFKGESVEVCLPMVTPEQTVEYKQINLIPEYEGEQVSGLYLIINDITAHKHTTDLLQQKTDFFRSALEGARVGIWDWDFLKGQILWSSPQEQLFGLKPGSFDGQPDTFFALVDARDRLQLEADIDQALQPQHHFSAEFRTTLPDGSIRWLSHRGRVLRDEQGLAIRMVGVSFDITGQKEAEEKLLLQVKRDQLIAKISQEISRSENLTQVLPQVVREVRQYLNVDRLAMIDLRQQMAGKVTFEDHAPTVESMLTWEMRHPWAVREAFLEKYRQGHPVAVTNVHEQSLSAAELGFLDFFQIAADLTVPLLEDQKLWGLLSVHSRTPREWQPEDRRLLETLSTLVSTAIQRDLLHRNLTQANQKLKRFAYLDGLTQVANRRRFEQFIHHEWRRLMREHSPLALIMADIDHFKAYNDIYGHQSGDECLRRVAGTLRSVVQRPADMVARYGGEEFVVVLPNTDLEGAETVAQKIRTMIQSQKIPHQGSTVSQFVTMSLGVAVMLPHPLKSPDNLIEAADMALYQAKEQGRDRIVCHPPLPSPPPPGSQQ
jgi:diguanylate cyclase (GGDEF)-like protein/PAS domain S-box-containing protein